MASKCISQNCNRKPDLANNQNLCIRCFEWFLKCRDQSQVPQQPHSNPANYQELLSIYTNISDGAIVDQNLVMKALLGSMISLMNQNGQVLELREEVYTLKEQAKDLANELSEAKHKLFKLEYDFEELEKKDEFSTRDTIVIRNLPVPDDGDELKVVKEALTQLHIEDFLPEEDVIKVTRKGNKNGKLGSVFVKISDEEFKVKIMKKKKDLLSHNDSKMKALKMMNYKSQEQILTENALRQILSVTSNGHLYELNGNMRLVTKQ